MRRRAQQIEETARRIAQAAFELHASIGPSNTTISAIAERAGVERLTVYRHYPDERSLFRACVEHGLDALPMPDPGEWRGIADPPTRLRAGLDAMYRYYRRTETVWANILPDLFRMPALYGANARTFEQFGAIHETLARGWRVRGRRRRIVRAAIWLALQFPTWQTLAVQQGLSDAEAIELTVAAVACLAERASPLSSEP
ncbi:MAG: TetR/AcrR family transcriptional regulator [Actinomycetota bacterium]